MWRRRPNRRAEVAALLVLALPALSAAQSPPAPQAPSDLVTDRPGFGESSAVVARGTIQIESGLALDQIDRDRRDVSGQLLARVGIAPRLELRVAADGSDAEIGGKVKLADAERAGVDVALIGYLSLAAGAGGGGRARDPGFKIAASGDLPHGFGLSSTFNAADVTTGGVRAWQREVSVSLDHELRGRVAAYGEVDGGFGGGGCDCSVDGGVTVGVGANAQVDAEAGRGLHGAASDWFVGVGFVLRAPLRARRR